jgi:Holliday junction resolvasome RuvABC endonuclease subunit
LKVWGGDISLNHGAIIQLKSGKLDRFWFWTDKVGIAKLGGKHATLLKVPKSGDKQTDDIARLVWIRRFLTKLIKRERPEFAAVEDYAHGMAYRAHQIGEVGGQIREIFWRAGLKFRLHDPLSVKMYATGDGTADKDNVRWNVQRKWGGDFDRFAPPKKNAKQKKQDTETAEDLCDAMALAQLCNVEALLRAGKLTMDKLEHDHERRVFIRTTKACPVNILGREWIRKPFVIKGAK